jgi:nucleoside-diphosphate-sugar epimerase
LKQISDESLRLFHASLLPNEKVLITGASGWFGQTVISQLAGSGVPVFYTGSHKRTLDILGATADIRSYSLDEIKAFEPTLIFDFAFVTREFTTQFDGDTYFATNQNLTSMALMLLELPSVRRAVVCSSGAAVHPVDAATLGYEANPYGFLKRLAEKQFEELAVRLGKNIVCLRPWSVSGPQTTKPLGFAFSSFIEQARQSSRIIVSSRRKVFRRYTSVSDLVALGLAQTLNSQNPYRVLDSGGELIDLVSLAKLIAMLAGRGVEVQSDIDEGLPVDNYYSDGTAWEAACKNSGFEAEGLESQILRSLEFQRHS